jgi:class 3 adenylate cyclase
VEAHVMVVLPYASNGDHPEYRRFEINAADLAALIKYCDEAPPESRALQITDLGADKVAALLSIFEIINTGSDNGILIPFNCGPINMGYFVLWEPDPSKPISGYYGGEVLRSWVATYYKFLQSFFSREYQILPQTYLPSYYASRWGKAAILFADIRNFTPLTEVLRNAYAHSLRQDTTVFREIMDEHCREMANIIQIEGRGRIDKFLGDGIMAIFGEHEPENSAKAVCRAVSAAALMVERFNKLKPGFLKKAFGGEYETEYNESVDLDLGVGIDYGTVLFDYLGDDQHREYTAVGDHVNFAQRLESNAARFDERTRTSYPPILISRTAERCIRPWLYPGEVQEVIVNPKGKGQYYKVYGLNPSGFHRTLYNQSEMFENWNLSLPN